MKSDMVVDPMVTASSGRLMYNREELELVQAKRACKNSELLVEAVNRYLKRDG